MKTKIAYLTVALAVATLPAFADMETGATPAKADTHVAALRSARTVQVYNPEGNTTRLEFNGIDGEPLR